MSKIIKFPVTTFERLLVARTRKLAKLNNAELLRGERAALARAESVQARLIALRIAAWLAHNAELASVSLSASIPPGWHFEMIHGRKPTVREEISFWNDMNGGSESFRLGFTRGLLQIVAGVLRTE